MRIAYGINKYLLVVLAISMAVLSQSASAVENWGPEIGVGMMFYTYAIAFDAFQFIVSLALSLWILSRNNWKKGGGYFIGSLGAIALSYALVALTTWVFLGLSKNPSWQFLLFLLALAPPLCWGLFHWYYMSRMRNWVR
jgi:hypothetical protein